MKLRMLIRLGAGIGLLVGHAYAGDEGAFGGYSVACFQNEQAKLGVEKILTNNRDNNRMQDVLPPALLAQLQSVELLELYGQNSSVCETSAEDIFTDRMNLLERKTQWAQVLKESSRDLAFAGWVAAPYGLRETRDAVPRVLLPSNCLAMQIALQDHFVDERVLYFDPRLYALLKPSHRAALWLHEWTYAMSVSRGQNDARAAQQLVRLVFSGDFSALSGWALHQELRRLNLADVRVAFAQNILLHEQNFELWATEGAKGTIDIPLSEVRFVDPVLSLLLPEGRISILGERIALLRTTGDRYQVSHAELSEEAELHGLRFAGKLQLHSNGRVLGGTLAKAGMLGGVFLPERSVIVFSSEGLASWARLPEGVRGSQWPCAANTGLSFDDHGNFATCN